MIIAAINGGLGNQIFQYAAAYTLAKKKNCKLLLDVSAYQRNKWEHEMRLNQIIEMDEILIKNIWLSRLIRFIFRILDTITLGKIKYSKLGENSVFEYLEIPNSSNYFMNGYFQNVKYFEEQFEKFLNKFKLNLKKQNEKKTKIAIHSRKADLSDTEIDICKKDYFKRALEELIKIESLNLDDIELFIFCEELDWPKKNLNFENIKTNFIIGNDKTCIYDFKTMSKCSHIIMSNSSFSWWHAAIISKISNGKVICPDLWLNSIPINKINIYPKEWIKIKTY